MFSGRVMSFLRSKLLTGAGLTAVGTGACIAYQDFSRYAKIEHRFSEGHILPPLSDTTHQVPYFGRPDCERKIDKILNQSFTNEYYLIKGEVGTGKSRLVIECVKERMDCSGKKGQGAPIYVLASQGKGFPETLAAAVDFAFDEHISFTFFLNFLLGIHSMPGKDETHKLRRVLDAIEEAAHLYMKKTGKPAVIVIDEVDYLSKHCPAALDRLQEKAKVWADTNVAKVIFITNNEAAEGHLQINQSSWSRADEPIYIGNLSNSVALEFLTSKNSRIISHQREENTKDLVCIDRNTATFIVEKVGGRIQHLLQIRRDLCDGLSLEDAIGRQEGKEKDKLINLASRLSSLNGLKKIIRASNQTLDLNELMKEFSRDDLKLLIEHNIICIKRDGSKIGVKFYSRLTENVLKTLV